MRTTTKQMAMQVLFVALVAALVGDLIWLAYEPHIGHVIAWSVLTIALLCVTKWLEKHDF